MTELELMANEEARHGNREALERLEREAELQAQEIDKTRRRADKWQSMVIDCEEYLKPGETPRQRMDRDHADVLGLIKLLETEKRKSERLEAQLVKATELLIQTTEENLWNAYHSGHCDEADAWTHMFMSDGEWLVREIGLDPEQARYNAEEIRDAIPATARKIVLDELTGGKDE